MLVWNDTPDILSEKGEVLNNRYSIIPLKTWGTLLSHSGHTHIGLFEESLINGIPIELSAG